MAILDGEFIHDKDIDPVKHKFIGTFREPFSTYENMAGEHHCRCGEHLFNNQSMLDHWQRGHMDAAQYVSIGREEVAPDGAITKRRICCFCADNDSRLMVVCEGFEVGTLFVKFDNFAVRVNFCPLCGKKAPKQIGG